MTDFDFKKTADLLSALMLVHGLDAEDLLTPMARALEMPQSQRPTLEDFLALTPVERSKVARQLAVEVGRPTDKGRENTRATAAIAAASRALLDLACIVELVGEGHETTCDSKRVDGSFSNDVSLCDCIRGEIRTALVSLPTRGSDALNEAMASRGLGPTACIAWARKALGIWRSSQWGVEEFTTMSDDERGIVAAAIARNYKHEG